MCPFHEEKTPSFIISIKNNVILYYCFGCGARGNILQFLQKHNQLDFNDALKELSKITGKSLPKEFNTILSKEEHKLLHKFDLYNKNLMEHNLAKEHLIKRGVVDFSIFGYDKGTYKILSRHLNKYHIFDYKPNNKPKYIYPRGFNKDFPFNFHNISGKDIYLTEGIFDSIVLFDNLNINSVSLLGSTLSNKTIPLLKKFENIILFLDNDTIGRSNTIKILDTLYKNGFINLFYINYKDFKYKDINDAFQHNSLTNIKKLLNESIEEGYKIFIDEHYKKRNNAKNDLEEIKLINAFSSKITNYNSIIKNKITSLYEKTFGKSIKEIVEHFQYIITADEYKKEVLNIIHNENYSINSIKEIGDLSQQKESVNCSLILTQFAV